MVGILKITLEVISMAKRLSAYFVRGLLFFIPAVITLYLFYVAFVKLDRMLGLPIPGMGLVITLAFITLLGFLASNFITRKLFNIMDRILTSIPLVKILYSSLKDITGALVGEEKTFDHPVLVDISPDGAIKILGFITRHELEEWGLKDQVSVYLPQSYNFAGNLIIVPKEKVTTLDVDGPQVLTFILSGGVAGKR
jgi:uncharacterized membrane protein